MNDEFVDEALRNDRCLKAHRLLQRFETEIRAELRDWGSDLIEENPDLFPEDVGSKIRVSWDNSTIIANARDNLNLYRVNEDQPTQTQNLNISLRWVDPIEWGEEDTDGALCAACYKINGGNQSDFERVKRDTIREEWDIAFGDDQFNNAPGILYIPVETADDLRRAIKALQKHFGKFGEYWGVEPSNTTN